MPSLEFPCEKRHRRSILWRFNFDKGFNIGDSVLPVRLTDATETGGLLG